MRKIGERSVAVVEHLVLTAILLTAWSIAGLAQTNPIPLINEPVSPDAVAPGGAGFTLTVNGAGFVSSSVVSWSAKGVTTPLATIFISASKLTATVPATDVAAAGAALITVVNPAPGGGTSNQATFEVGNTTSVLQLTPSYFSTPQSQYCAVTGDFNNDGIPDIAVAEYQGQSNTGTLSILLGNGDGTLRSPVNYGISGIQDYLTTGDFNHDGNLDLAVMDPSSNTFDIWLGNGDGTFQSPLPSPVVSGRGIIAGDFNEDGTLDMVVATGAAASVLLGNGDGTFGAPSTYPAGYDAFSVVAGDFNGDGHLDLALANQCGNNQQSCFQPGTVSILLGNGDGTFQPQQTFATDIQPDAIVAADFNGDAKLDLATTTYCGTDPNCESIGSVSVLLGNGDGTFQPEVSTSMGDSPPVALVAGDFNNDGKMDLAVATYSSEQVVTMLGNGNGTFGYELFTRLSEYPTSVAAADFNRDGFLDLVVAPAISSPSDFAIFLQTFQPLLSISPTQLSFQTQVVGTTSPSQTITLTNTGIEPLTISTLRASSSFKGTGSTCPASLAAGASCTAQVAFAPTTTGTITGSFTITDNAPGSPQTVTLSGTSTAASVSPTSINFGTVKVGKSSAPQKVTVTNAGKTSFTINSIFFSGGYADEFSKTTNCPASLRAGASCGISVVFTPFEKRTIGATLKIVDNAGGSPQQVNLSGSGD